jgi:hypothetical protein
VLDYGRREEGDPCVIFSEASCLVAKWRTISGVIVGIKHDDATAGDALSRFRRPFQVGG